MQLNFGIQETMKFHIAAAAGAAVGLQGNGINFISVMSESAYQELGTYDSQTLYIVQTADSIMLYLGAIPLGIHDSDTDFVHGHGVTDVTALTQSEYDDLENPAESVLYVIA